MKTDPFSRGVSLLHRLDPRLKVVWAIFFSVVVASVRRFDSLLISLLIATALVAFSGLGRMRICKRLAIANGISLLLWLVLPFTVPGETPTVLNSFVLSQAGIELALLLTIRLNVLVLALMALAATSSISAVGHALHALKMPEKLVHLLLTTYRYVSILERERQRLARAARIRCFKPKADTHTCRIYGYFAGMLLVRAAIRGESVHRAMLCRAFGGRLYCLHDFRFGRSDWLAAAVGLAALIWIGVWEWQTVV